MYNNIISGNGAQKSGSRKYTSARSAKLIVVSSPIHAQTGTFGDGGGDEADAMYSQSQSIGCDTPHLSDWCRASVNDVNPPFAITTAETQ